LGVPFPNQLLTVVLEVADSKRLAKSLKGKVIAVTGKLFTYNDQNDGKPIMYINFPEFIKVVKNSAR
jgi:hypothetical protein